jgi:hypothetical protein
VAYASLREANATTFPPLTPALSPLRGEGASRRQAFSNCRVFHHVEKKMWVMIRNKCRAHGTRALARSDVRTEMIPAFYAAQRSGSGARSDSRPCHSCSIPRINSAHSNSAEPGGKLFTSLNKLHSTCDTSSGVTFQ